MPTTTRGALLGAADKRDLAATIVDMAKLTEVPVRKLRRCILGRGALRREWSTSPNHSFQQHTLTNNEVAMSCSV